MKKEEIEKLVQLRGYLMSFYNQIPRESPGTSIVKASEAAHLCESSIKSIDDLLSKYVSFSKK